MYVYLHCLENRTGIILTKEQKSLPEMQLSGRKLSKDSTFGIVSKDPNRRAQALEYK